MRSRSFTDRGTSFCRAGSPPEFGTNVSSFEDTSEGGSVPEREDISETEAADGVVLVVPERRACEMGTAAVGLVGGKRA